MSDDINDSHGPPCNCGEYRGQVMLGQRPKSRFAGWCECHCHKLPADREDDDK